MANNLIIKMLTDYSVSIDKPNADNLIYKHYRQDAPHEQHDLVNFLIQAAHLDDLDKFYIDILPIYLSPQAMKFYLPNFLVELSKKNRKFADYAGFVLSNTYDPISNTKENLERLEEYKNLLVLRERELISLGFDHVSSIFRSNDEDSANQFSRISDFLISDGIVDF